METLVWPSVRPEHQAAAPEQETSSASTPSTVCRMAVSTGSWIRGFCICWRN